MGGEGRAAALLAAGDERLAGAVATAGRILVDVGCGDGRHTVRWALREPDALVVGIDAETTRLDRALAAARRSRRISAQSSTESTPSSSGSVGARVIRKVVSLRMPRPGQFSGAVDSGGHCSISAGRAAGWRRTCQVTGGRRRWPRIPSARSQPR